MNILQTKTVKWLATGSTGSSSEAMAFWLAFGQKTADNYAHPHDPDDLDRCLRLLDAVPELRQYLHCMSEVSPYWSALLNNWEAIETSHLNEVGLHWCKARSAPKTYALMRSVLDAVKEPA